MIEVVGGVSPGGVPSWPLGDPIGGVIVAGVFPVLCDANAPGTLAPSEFDFGFKTIPGFIGAGLAKLLFGKATRFLGGRARLLNDSMLVEAGSSVVA